MKTTIKKVAQKCPVCEGRKTMPLWTYSSNSYGVMANSNTPTPCQTCKGEGIIWSEEKTIEDELKQENGIAIIIKFKK